MSDSLTAQSVSTLNTLRDQLARLAGGSLEMGGFTTWFRSLRWDSETGFNSPDLASLGWAIETSLFEFDLVPEHYRLDDLTAAVEDVMQREGLTFPASLPV
jgi:hypothetical protein